MLAAKPLEVKLFGGHDLISMEVSASHVLDGAARRSANVIFICRVARNLPLPPPVAPENADQFLPDATESPFAYRERFLPDRFEIANGCHGDSMPPDENSRQVSGLCGNSGQFDR